MKLKANVTVVAGKKIHAPGDTFDINEEEGQRLVDRKFAALIDGQSIQKGAKIKPDPEAPSDDA